MQSDNIECGGNCIPVHLQPHVAQVLGTKPGDFPVCEYVAERSLALPLYTRLTTSDVDWVCESLDRAIEKVLMGRCKGQVLGPLALHIYLVLFAHALAQRPSHAAAI